MAVQPQYRICSELLVGVNSVSEFGPLVVCGLGGIFVEVMGRVAGRLSHFGDAEGRRLVAEINVGGVLDGLRGTPPWPREALAALLSAVGDLAPRPTRGWSRWTSTHWR